MLRCLSTRFLWPNGCTSEIFIISFFSFRHGILIHVQHMEGILATHHTSGSETKNNTDISGKTTVKISLQLGFQSRIWLLEEGSPEILYSHRQTHNLCLCISKQALQKPIQSWGDETWLDSWSSRLQTSSEPAFYPNCKGFAFQHSETIFALNKTSMQGQLADEAQLSYKNDFK